MTKTATDSVFTADPEGFREQNLGRPAAHLVREAIQNVFDEVENGASVLSVTLTWSADEGVRFCIGDNVPGGIRDERLIWTIWLSDKVDSPTKRGRMGRGLKELISVSDETLIVTAGGPAVHFQRSRGKWVRSSPRKVRPKAGTIVEGRVKAWRQRDMNDILTYLRRMRPPEGLTFTVNGEEVERRPATERYTLKLPTVVFEQTGDGGRVAREPSKETLVELFHEDESWVYEMGIPIEPIDYPLSIDVGQRVPLREKRDTLTEPYRRKLYALLLDVRAKHGHIKPEDMKDNHVLIAVQAHDHLSPETKKAIADVWTGGKPYAVKPQDVQSATGQHISVVPLRSLPEVIRDITREVGTDVRQVMEERVAVSCCPITDLNEQQRRFIDVWSWIAAGIKRRCAVVLSTGRPSATASFNRLTRTLTVYVEQIGGFVIANPLSAQALSTLIHELSHWKVQEDEHGMGFHADSEDVGGLVAWFLLEHAEEARERAVLR